MKRKKYDTEQLKIGVSNYAKRRRKERLRINPLSEYFESLYDKPKEYQLPKKSINMNRFFNFSINKEWEWPKQTFAIYPVLCSQADLFDNNWFQISEKNLAKLSGMKETSVRIGIDYLLEMDYCFHNKQTRERVYYLEREMEQEGRRRYYKYKVGFVRGDMMHEGWKYFPFYHCIIELGIWSKLSLRAKALYLSIRMNSFFDSEIYSQVEGEEEPVNYETRKWELCTVPISELCRSVGINNRNLEPVFNQLEEYRLIEKYDKGIKVYLIPKPDNPLVRNPEKKDYKNLIKRVKDQ